MRLIDADELKSLYSKEETAIRSRLFSVIDRTPTEPKEEYIPVEWLENLLKTDKILMNYKLVIYEIIEKWREENEIER